MRQSFASGHGFSRAEPHPTKTWPLGPEAKTETLVELTNEFLIHHTSVPAVAVPGTLADGECHRPQNTTAGACDPLLTTGSTGDHRVYAGETQRNGRAIDAAVTHTIGNGRNDRVDQSDY